MKTLFPSLLIFILSLTAQAQSVKMVADYGSDNSEITQILMFQNIDYFRVKFIGEGLTGKYFSVYCKEMWDGEVRKIDTVVTAETQKRIGKISGDTLTLIVFGDREDDKLKLFFRFPMVGFNKKYDALITDDYSLRAVGMDADIQFNKPFPAFAYILPYEVDGWKLWCEVDSSGANVEAWGKKFNIKHYLIFEFNFHD